MADVKTSIASIAAAAALIGGTFVGTYESPIEDIVLSGEKVSARTLTTKTIDLGKGRGVLVSKTTPMHYMDPEDSVFKAIQTEIFKRPILTAIFSEYEYRTSAGTYTAYYDKDKPWNYRAESPDGKKWIEFEALFDESEDLAIDVKTVWNGVKETITLRSEKAPAILKWLVDSNGVNTEPPTAWDAKLNPVPVVETTSGDTLIYTVDAGKAIYPICVDPTVVFVDTDATTGYMYTISDSTRSARDSLTATAAIPTQTSFGTLTTGGAWWMMRALFRFDTSAIPDTDTITDVDLVTVLNDTAFYSTAGGNYYKVIAAHDTLPTDSFTVNATHSFEGWASGINAAYTPTVLTDSLTLAPGIAFDDTITFSGISAFNDEVNKTGTTQLFVVMGEDMGAGTYDYVNQSTVTVKDDEIYLKITYTDASGLTIGGAPSTISVGGTAFDSFGGVSP